MSSEVTLHQLVDLHSYKQSGIDSVLYEMCPCFNRYISGTCRCQLLIQAKICLSLLWSVYQFKGSLWAKRFKKLLKGGGYWFRSRHVYPCTLNKLKTNMIFQPIIQKTKLHIPRQEYFELWIDIKIHGIQMVRKSLFHSFFTKEIIWDYCSKKKQFLNIFEFLRN